ncbi:ABC transporter ATP-binding protein [Calditrichota bacterium]
MTNPSTDGTGQPSISFKGAAKTYNTFKALNPLDLDIPSGELFGFLGPNGAGKTTAMKLAAGLVKATSGSVSICGHDVQDDPIAAKRLIGFVPDSPYIYESLTGREFLHFCAGLYSLDHDTTAIRLPELLEEFGIGTWVDKRAGEYSHGMKQRVVMASAFIHKPRVILIDEPMVGLDPAAIRLIKNKLRQFCASGGAVFLSTHTLHDAEELCDRLAIIKDGSIIAIGSVQDVASDGRRLEEAFLDLTGTESHA